MGGAPLLTLVITENDLLRNAGAADLISVSVSTGGRPTVLQGGADRHGAVQPVPQESALPHAGQ